MAVPAGPVRGRGEWPGELLLILRTTLAVVGPGGVLRLGPECLSPVLPPRGGSLLYQGTGGAYAVAPDLLSPPRFLGRATRLLGGTEDGRVFVEVAEDSDDEELAGASVYAVLPESAQRQEVFRQAASDPHGWQASRVLDDGRLVLTRRHEDWTSERVAFLRPDGDLTVYRERTRFLGVLDGRILLTQDDPRKVFVDSPRASWAAALPADWYFTAALAVLPRGEIVTALHRREASCLAIAEPGSNFETVSGSAGANAEIGVAVGGQVIFGGRDTRGAVWLAKWAIDSGTPAELLEMTEQMAWSQPRLLAISE